MKVWHFWRRWFLDHRGKFQRLQSCDFFWCRLGHMVPECEQPEEESCLNTDCHWTTTFCGGFTLVLGRFAVKHPVSEQHDFQQELKYWTVRTFALQPTCKWRQPKECNDTMHYWLHPKFYFTVQCSKNVLSWTILFFSCTTRCWRIWEKHHRKADEVSYQLHSLNVVFAWAHCP